VLDQERFDELARGLAANHLSRGQVLKSFAAGLLLSSIGALSPRHTRVGAAQPTVPEWCKNVPNPAPPTPVKPTYPKEPANVIKGDCKAFRRRALKKGAKDSQGFRKGRAGATECGITHTNPTFKTTAPKPGVEVVCLTTTSVGPVTFKARSTTYMLDWQREGAPSKECKAYESKFEREVKEHEKVHANDCHAVAKAASTAWNSKNHEFADCGKTPEVARINIAAKIDAYLDDFADKQVRPCLDDRAKEFHKSEQGARICCEGRSGCGCPKGKECCTVGSNPKTGPVYGCVDLKTDPKNCGSCGNVCEGANTSCEAGKCVCPSGGGTQCCDPGKTFCPNVGCVDLSHGIFNPDGYGTDYCGACDDRCVNGSGASCVQGKCQCPPQLTTCLWEGGAGPGGNPNPHPNEKVECCIKDFPVCCHDSKGRPFCCPANNACATTGQGCIPP